MASLRVLAFDHEGKLIQFDTWLNDLQLYLLSDSRDGVSLFDHTSGAAPAPPATANSATRSKWLTRDAASRLAIPNHLPLAKCAHFRQHRTAQALYDAVVARYSSPATAALGRLLLPSLFPELSTFATVEDLVSHLRASNARYHVAAPAEYLDKNQPPMFITLYFIVTRLPDCLRSDRDHFLSLDPTILTVDQLEQHLLAAETSVVAVTRARVAGVVEVVAGVVVGAAVEVVEAVEVVAAVGVVAGVGALVAAVEAAVGVAVVAAVGVVAVGLELGVEILEEARGSDSSVRERPRHPSSFTCAKPHTQHRCFSRLDDAWHAEFCDEIERPHWEELLRSGVVIFDLDFDAILSAMYALSASAEDECYLCVPPDLGIEAAALGASESSLPGTAPAEALHTFTLDSGASRCFFRDSTTLTPLPALVPIRLADPSGGPVVAHSSTILPCPAVPSGSLSGLHLPSFSTNLPPQVAASTLVSASGQVAPPCSCHLRSHQTLLWHHRLGHPSLPRLRGMHSRLLVSGLPRSLPPLPPFHTCIEGWQRASPHSSSFPPTTAPLHTLHMDVWGPARVSGQGRERYGLLVVDDYTRYTTVFTLRSKGQVVDVSIPWIRAVRLQLRERLRADLPVLCLHSNRGGEFSSDLLGDFCRGEGILQSFTLLDSPQQNGIAERHIGLVMELSARAIPCVFLVFPPDAPGWQFYHPTSRHVFSSHDVTFDESVPFYRLFPFRSALPPPPPLFLPPGPPPVDPLPPLGLAPSGAARGAACGGAEPGGAEPGGVEPVGVVPGGAESEGARSGGAKPGGAEPGGAEPGVLEPEGVEPEGVEPGGADFEGSESGGVASRGAASSGGPTAARAGATGDTGAGGSRVTAGAGGTGGTAAAGPGGACTSGTGAAGTGGVGGAGAGDPTELEAAGTGGAGAGGTGSGVGGVGSVDPGPGAGGAGGTSAGGTVQARPYFVPLLQKVLGVLSSTSLTPSLLCPLPDQSQLSLQPASPLLAPSSYTEQSGSLTERCKLASRPDSPVCTARRVPHSRPPPVLSTHTMALCPSSFPLRVPLPPPPESSLPAVPDPGSDLVRAASPTVSRILATIVTDPSFESTAASALVAELVGFAAACRLDYTTALVDDSESASPPSVGGDCALGTDVLEDRQEDFECLATAVPRFAAMLLAPEGDPDAPDIPTPRSYAEAIRGPNSSQWQAAMDAKMASWKSTGTYVDAVPLSLANIVDGMWIFRVKRPSRSPPAFEARSRDELHSLDFSTAFLQGSLYEEIWQRRPPGFTGSFPPCTQTTLAALGFTPSTADPSLFLCTDTSLPPFYVLMYVDDLVFATTDTEALTLLKLELQKRHSCTDLGELRSYLGLQITRDRARRTITLTQSHMVHQVLQHFGFQFSSPQPTPLSTGHSLSAPSSDKSVEPSGPYPKLVGCLMYLMTCTRTDLPYPLSLLARYVAPGRHRKVHWDAAKRVLRYLCSTSGMGLVLGGRGPVVLSGHADASWVDDSATQRSSQDYTFSLGSGAVSWRSTRLSLALSSSCEAEIYAGAMAAQELHWFTYLLTNLGEQPCSPPILYVDNKAMVALCQEHRLEHKTKHIALQYFLAGELQQCGQLRLAYVATRANTADVFTKALPPGDHQRFSTVLDLVPTLPHLLIA
ncbi:unnamed protein product [Closterium sp. NIES-53]